jgi:hypothetical protein
MLQSLADWKEARGSYDHNYTVTTVIPQCSMPLFIYSRARLLLVDAVVHFTTKHGLVS